MKVACHLCIDQGSESQEGARSVCQLWGRIARVTCITVLACVNAAGYAIPPMVIYAWSNLSQKLTRGEVPGTMWIDSELFTEWFEQHFLFHGPAGRPILLMLDGHSSHYDPHFIRSAAEKAVIVFMLPPNITHGAQPLDITPFKCMPQ